MTIEERIAKAKKDREEKRKQLKAKIAETRALTERDDSNMGDMQACIDACKTLQADIETLDKDIQTMAEACGLTETNDDEPTDPTDPTAGERSNVKSNVETRDAEGKLHAINGKGGKKVKGAKADDEVRAFDAYMRSKGETRDGLTTSGTEITIPKAVMELYTQPKKTHQLSELVNRKTVTLPAGTLPVLKKQGAGLVSAEELAASPDLALPQFIDVEYKVATYRGKMPVSQEALDDGQVNVGALVAEFLQDAKNLTEQRKIGEVLKTATAKTATSLDDVKNVFNVNIPIGYDKQFVVTQSAFGVLDTLKDANGRYLLQDSISSASGKAILGANVTVVEDEVLGAAGDKLMFVGDPYSYVLETVRVDATAKWIDNEDYGQVFHVYFRADFEKADPDAGYLVTLNITAPTQG